MKLEYGFQKINRYKNVSLETWEENYNNISSMDADEFYFELHSFSDKSRFYIRSDDELFKKTFRNLVVPKLTNAIFSKDEVAKIITIKLDINFDADTLTDVSKTVSVEGIPALSIEDLGRILKDMYNNAKESGQVAAIHMFGFKYGDIITANGYSQKAIISLAGINDSYSVELNKGVNIYKSVKANEYGVSFDENPIKDEDMLSHNVYGIHITGKSNALSSENPHICIGWSKMGDLSSCADKDSISEKYAKAWPDAKAKSRGQNIGQIYRFVVESKIGDYIVFGDGSTAHIGVIASDYYYQENPQDQDPNYVNNKSVKWLKDVPYAELSSQFINKRAEEGDWGEWADKLPSQFLSKQSLTLVNKQLNLAASDKMAEFDEICSLTNPTVKKSLLKSFADDCDSAAVHLQAAALPRQKYQVILPITSMKDNEVYWSPAFRANRFQRWVFKRDLMIREEICFFK